ILPACHEYVSAYAPTCPPRVFHNPIVWSIPHDQNGVIWRRPAGAVEHAALVTLETAAGIHHHGNRLVRHLLRQELLVAFWNRNDFGNRRENCIGGLARSIASGIWVRRL